MDPMCYLPVQRIPGNYHEKKKKGTRRKQQPKTPQTKLVGVLSCSICTGHRLSSLNISEIPDLEKITNPQITGKFEKLQRKTQGENLHRFRILHRSPSSQRILNFTRV